MAKGYLWIKGEWYYYYNTFDTWNEALAITKEKKRENRKNRHYIYIEHIKTMFGISKRYHLYMTKYMTPMAVFAK